MKNYLHLSVSPTALLGGAAIALSVLTYQLPAVAQTSEAAQEVLDQKEQVAQEAEQKVEEQSAEKPAAETQVEAQTQNKPEETAGQPEAQEQPEVKVEEKSSGSETSQQEAAETTEPAPTTQESEEAEALEKQPEPASQEQPVEKVQEKESAPQETQTATEGKSEEAPSQEAAEQEEAAKAEAETKEPVTVSQDAEVPKEEEPVTVEAQVEKAAEEQVVVVPDAITPKQQAALKAAEAQRREDARKRRRELIGAAAVGVAVGAIIPQLGGKVAADEGDILVIERDGDYYTQRDDSSLFRGRDVKTTYETRENGRTREIIERPNGVKVITVRDSGGFVLRRVKQYPDGERVVLYDFRESDRRERIDYGRRLDPLRLDIARDRYVVSARRADRRLFYDTLRAEPVEVTRDRYTLRDIRENERLRAKVRRVDLDTIVFETGSAFVTQSQVRLLGDVAGAMLDVVEQDPSAVFFIEGHTDAVGSELSNLTLSDRRAEAVGRILSDAYGVPPENLVIQGYGEEFLKVDTQGPSAANRRASIRNISQLLEVSSQ